VKKSKYDSDDEIRKTDPDLMYCPSFFWRK